MIRRKNISTVVIGLILGTVLLSAPIGAKEIYLADTGLPGGSAHSMLVTFAKMAGREGVNIQINAGKTLTVSMLEAAKNKIDFYSGVPFFLQAMRKKIAMYKSVEDAPELAKNIRYIFTYEAGLTHMLVYADSGIETMKDFKGKKIFLGPPSGAATWEAKTAIKAATGYEEGRDYQGVILNWGEGIQAMKDKKIDVLFRPIQLGSALIEQFGLTDSFRLINLPKSAIETEVMQDILAEPDYLLTTVPPNTYRGQKNTESVTQLGYYLSVGTNAAVPEDDVYKAVKGFWENLEEVQATAKYMEALNQDNAFDAVNGPLHIGAYRYYKEAGFKIPDAIVPPEAQ